MCLYKRENPLRNKENGQAAHAVEKTKKPKADSKK